MTRTLGVLILMYLIGCGGNAPEPESKPVPADPPATAKADPGLPSHRGESRGQSVPIVEVPPDSATLREESEVRIPPHRRGKPARLRFRTRPSGTLTSPSTGP